MKLSRRRLSGLGLASLAFGGLARSGWADTPAGYRSEVAGYGPLLADPAGFFDLPAGFSYRVISRAGEAMDDGFVTPGKFDGMGCFPLGGERVALVRNHELEPHEMALGAAGDGAGGVDQARLARLARLPAFDRNADGRVLPGGATTITYDLARERRVSVHLSLAGTSTNCAGGVTPWGSWLSCEETVSRPPSTSLEHGWVFETPADQVGLAAPIPLKAMGRFRHEAVAIDPATGIAYLTEDREDGLFYRFLPNSPQRLADGGRLQALALTDGVTDSRNWTARDFTPHTRRTVRWIDLSGVESPDDTLRHQGRAGGALVFARGEGIHFGQGVGGRGELFFCCTSGGAGRYGQIFKLQPGSDGDALELFVESADPQVIDYADNLTIAPWGHLIVCEDRTGAKVNFLRGVTPGGRIYTLARLRADTELAGACFSPDGAVLFVNAYDPGATLAIKGPWGRFSDA